MFDQVMEKVGGILFGGAGITMAIGVLLGIVAAMNDDARLKHTAEVLAGIGLSVALFFGFFVANVALIGFYLYLGISSLISLL